MTTPHQPRNSERGGIVIILVLILLAAMTVTAFSVNKSTMREILITGSETTGRKAAEAADSGIDWMITWGHNLTAAAAAGEAARTALRTKMDSLINAIDNEQLREAKADATHLGNTSSEDGRLRVYLDSKDYADSEFFLKVPTTTKGDQDTVVRQAFDLELRFMGYQELEGSSTRSSAANKRYYFIIRSTGRATVGDTGQSFIATREGISDFIP